VFVSASFSLRLVLSLQQIAAFAKVVGQFSVDLVHFDLGYVETHH